MDGDLDDLAALARLGEALSHPLPQTPKRVELGPSEPVLALADDLRALQDLPDERDGVEVEPAVEDELEDLRVLLERLSHGD